MRSAKPVSTTTEAWETTERLVRRRAARRCEGSPAHPHCRAEHLELHPDVGWIVVLQLGALDRSMLNGDHADWPANWRLWCQRCARDHYQIGAPKVAADVIGKLRVSATTYQFWTFTDRLWPGQWATSASHHERSRFYMDRCEQVIAPATLHGIHRYCDLVQAKFLDHSRAVSPAEAWDRENGVDAWRKANDISAAMRRVAAR